MTSFQLNGPFGDVASTAHLLEFDSIHSRWNHTCSGTHGQVHIDDRILAYTQNTDIDATNWSECDLVIEASGKFKNKAELAQ